MSLRKGSRSESKQIKLSSLAPQIEGGDSYYQNSEFDFECDSARKQLLHFEKQLTRDSDLAKYKKVIKSTLKASKKGNKDWALG